VAVNTTSPHRDVRFDGVRRMDHLEAGVRDKPKRVPGAHRVRVHVPSSKVRSTYDLVRAWTVVALTSGTGGVVVAIFTTYRGH